MLPYAGAPTPPPRKKRLGNRVRTLLFAGLALAMLFIWWTMHSMLARKDPAPPPAAADSLADAPLPGQPPLSAIARASASASSSSSSSLAVGRPAALGPASLTPSDLAKLSAVLGPGAGNFTRGEFVSVPAWVTKDPEAGKPAPPCLFSAKTKFNVFLFEDGWRDAAPADTTGGGGGGQAPCPLPRGGQRPLAEGDAPELSVVLAFRNMATETIRALLSVVHNAAQVASVEVLVLDIASSEEGAAEVKAFVQHLITHLDLRIRLFRFADPLTASLSRAVSKAASSLATGKHLLVMNCDVALQPGSLRAMLAVFKSHPATGMVVPKFLQPSGQILDSGGLVFSDGSGWQYGRDEQTSKPAYNYIRPTDYGSSYCVMVLRSLFVDLKLYAPAYSPAWYDDTDAAFAIRQAGFNVYFTPFAEVVVSETADLVITSSKALLLEQNRNKFQAKWAHVLSCHYLHETVSSQYDAYIAATRLSSFRLLFMDWIVPEPDRDSGSIRTVNMLQILLAMRVHVTFAVKDVNRDPTYSTALRYLGVEVVSLKELDYHRSKGAGCRYDLIVVARREVYDDVYEKLQTVCQAAPKVFDTVDLHFMRENKEVEFKQTHDAALLKAVFGAKNWNKLDGQEEKGVSSQTRELKYVEHSKVTVVVSEVETKEIRKFLPQATIVRISNIHADLEQEITPLGFDQRKGAVFVGNWNHLPNRDAVLWFVRDILPLVHPKVDKSFVLHVVGANAMPPEISQLNNTVLGGTLRVVVHGYVEDLRALYGSMRLSVAPLRWGAGVKGKINSSMKYGVPVVCTTVSTEGMFAEPRANIMSVPEGDAGAFAAAVVELYGTRSLWETVRAGGLANVRDHFSVSDAAGGMAEMLSLGFTGEDRVARQLDLGSRALLMGQCGARR